MTSRSVDTPIRRGGRDGHDDFPSLHEVGMAKVTLRERELEIALNGLRRQQRLVERKLHGVEVREQKMTGVKRPLGESEPAPASKRLRSEVVSNAGSASASVPPCFHFLTQSFFFVFFLLTHFPSHFHSSIRFYTIPYLRPS